MVAYIIHTIATFFRIHIDLVHTKSIIAYHVVRVISERIRSISFRYRTYLSMHRNCGNCWFTICNCNINTIFINHVFSNFLLRLRQIQNSIDYAMQYDRYGWQKLALSTYGYGSIILSNYLQNNNETKEVRPSGISGTSNGREGQTDGRRNTEANKIERKNMFILRARSNRFRAINILPPTDRRVYNLKYVVDAEDNIDVHLMDEDNLTRYFNGDSYSTYLSSLNGSHHENIALSLPFRKMHLVFVNRSNREIAIHYQAQYV